MQACIVVAVINKWWTSLKDQFRRTYKAQKSGSGGVSAGEKRIQWQFYNEMSLMWNYIYSRQYVLK